MRLPDYKRDEVALYCGDCMDVMPGIRSNSIDSIVTDPPYGLKFMGKGWDHGVPGVEYWREVLRVAKPGAHLLAFGGTRTYHRLICAIEDAGFEIRDCIMWVYGSGFPKSHDVSKAIDKDAGATRERIRGVRSGVVNATYAQDAWSQEFKDSVLSNSPITDAAAQWNGWGTALKPAWEPIIVARKPIQGTVAGNVLKHGTGGINVDGSRISVTDQQYAKNASGDRGHSDNRSRNMEFNLTAGSANTIGRFPANLIHDGSDDVLSGFPDRDGGRAITNSKSESTDSTYMPYPQRSLNGSGRGDSGSAARFFYCAKASKADRGADNKHPTVKPNALMRYLVKLVTPPGGVVLDPFMGSGSTGKAAITEGFSHIGIERDRDSFDTAMDRIDKELASTIAAGV